MEVKLDWKEKNKKCLNAMQAFLDKVDNVQDEKLRLEIIGKMLKYDEALTEAATNEINRNKNCKNT